ncbi:hypothetical protein BGZ68_002384 [Mortierella alpina]|nr:hypothetical protein BGZ68_002384 [Mortierella alpina]
MKEKDLLSSFLVGNELHDSISFTQFVKLFPHAYKTHPEAKDLYRAYLNARHQIRKKVQRNIDIEARRNPFQLDAQAGVEAPVRDIAVLENAHTTERGDGLTATEDMDIEDVDKHLTLDQAIQELALAEKIYKKEVERLEMECNDFAEEFQNLDKELSSFAVPNGHVDGIDEEALMKDLQDLIERCDSILNNVPVPARTR